MESMKQQGQAQTNAGLYGQALFLNFTYTYISQAGGNPGNTGQHRRLGRVGRGELDLAPPYPGQRQCGSPLRSFLVQSSAFEWSWNNTKVAPRTR